MATSIGGMYVDMGTNVLEFKRDMGKAAEAVNTSQSKINKNLHKIDKGFLKLKKSISSVQGVIATGALAIGSAVLTAAALKQSDALAKMADTAGVSTDFLQEMNHAASLSGMSLNQMSDVTKRLNRRLGLFATDGGGPAAKAMQQLGINAFDAAGKVRSTEAVFDDIIRKLDGVESASEKAALASQFFGEDAGPKMIVMLKNGSKGIAEMRQEARDLGLVIEEKMLRNTEQANDKLDILHRTIKTQVTKSIVALTPEIITLTESFSKALPEIVSFGRGLSDVASNIGDIFTNLNASFDEMGDSMFAYFGGADVIAAARQRKEMMNQEAVAIDNLQEQLRMLETSGSTGAYFVNLERDASNAKKQVDALKDSTEKAVSRKSAKPKGEADPVAPTISDFDIGLTGMKKGLEEYEKEASNTFENVKSAAGDAMGSMEDFFTDMVTTGKADFKGLADSIIADIARIMIKKSIVAPIAGAIGGLDFGSMFGGFFADGGRPPVNKVSVVGERGPELFVPDTKGTIIPNHALGGIAGGHSQSVNVTNTISINHVPGSNAEETVRRMLPEITQATTAAVSRNIARGGNLSRQVGARR